MVENHFKFNPPNLTAHIVAGLLLLAHHSYRLELLREIKDKNINDWAKLYRLNQKRYDNHIKTIMADFYGLRYKEEDGRIVDELLYIKWKKEIIKRDSRKCFICDSTKKLEFHHKLSWKDYPDKRYDADNGLILCHGCHIKTESYGRRKIVVE